IKLVLVGDDSSGKTTLISSYVENFFPNANLGRVYEGHGLDVSINEKPYVVSLTDTAGQEELDRVRVTSYVGAHAFVIVYRLMDEQTWNNVVEKWIPEVKHEQPNVPIVIVG
ncbi:P-loop containing nucleoside triphosphate hydrolase protein, partial [Ascobolus immersus RN42]